MSGLHCYYDHYYCYYDHYYCYYDHYYCYYDCYYDHYYDHYDHYYCYYDCYYDYYCYYELLLPLRPLLHLSDRQSSDVLSPSYYYLHTTDHYLFLHNPSGWV